MDRDANLDAFRAKNIVTMLSLFQRRHTQSLVDLVVCEMNQCTSLFDGTENVMGIFLHHARLSDLSADQIVQIATAVNMNLSKFHASHKAAKAQPELQLEAKADLPAVLPAELPAAPQAALQADPPEEHGAEAEYQEPVALRAFFARVKARRATRGDGKPTLDDVAFYESELQKLEGGRQ